MALTTSHIGRHPEARGGQTRFKEKKNGFRKKSPTAALKIIFSFWLFWTKDVNWVSQKKTWECVS